MKKFFNKKKSYLQKIKWIPESNNSWNLTKSPTPAKNHIPKWFKDIPLWHDKEKKINIHPSGEYDINSTVKKCVPFMDTFLTGYIQTLWCDIIFYKNDNGSINFEHNGYDSPIGIRDKTHLPIDDRWYPNEFVWQTKWEPLTPPGYSTLYIHPLNRIELPFFTISGIIDTDNWPVTGSYPFLLKNNFVGEIKRGTPIYQMIPLKREHWESEEIIFDKNVEKFINYKVNILKSYRGDGYRNEFWEKKNYG